MIPQSIELTGFLSYKERQAVRFDNAPLWMLAGTNGSGKSSIFDGVTYALFGSHRGGTQNAAELINKDSAALEVVFDFKLDGQLYRVKRTLKRGKTGSVSGTQQVFAHTGGPDGWAAVPDTNKKADFDKWVRDRIGLNYETFTSSVLLLQGRAEKLLDSTPSGRAAVLASIVDLERYQRLHEKANARKNSLKARLEALAHQAEAVPEVTDLEYAAALVRIDEAERAREDARTAIDALADLETQARRWADTVARLEASRGKLKHAESLLGEAVKIEQDYARLRELRDVLPAAQTVVTMRGQFKESQAKTARLLREKDEANDRKTRAEHALDQAKKKKALHQKTLADDEAKLSRAVARLRELAVVLEKLRQADDQAAELRRLDDDLSRFPKDPEALAHTAHAEVERLTELNRVLPILERFQTERHELSVARKAEQSAAAEQDRTKRDGEAVKADLARTQPEADRAKAARAAAEEQVAASRALADQAAAAAAEFATLSGAKTCKACGQPLTKEHFADEKRKREQEAKAAADRHRQAVDARTAAVSSDQELSSRLDALNRRVGELREAFTDQRGHARQAAADVARLTASLALRYAELPDPFRGRVAASPPADWTATAFPERDELVALRRDAAALDPAKRALRDAQDVVGRWGKLKARVESVRQTLAKLKEGLPAADPARLREEHRTLQAEETSLVASIKATKQALLTTDTEADKLGREAHFAVQAITEIQGKLHTEEATRKHCSEAADRALKTLPDVWRVKVEGAGLADYGVWQSDQQALIAAGTEGRYKQLEQARGGLDAIRAEIAALSADAAGFPEPARRPPDQVRAEIATARAALDQRDKDLRDAQRNKAVLDGHREQRAKLGGQYREADAAHNRYKVLSELLGKDRLQRYLVRQAERQIVDYANAVLDRLSGGQLFLRLVGSDDGGPAEKALELECSNRFTGGAPINVAFLSGSQRFRVAVSLALAIGQYASRQHRPIESVIIDEGFGCLDRQGRQVMIQELQNLRGHLHCILLVSHQEEFADAFPDGYRFELEAGATRVKRFVR